MMQKPAAAPSPLAADAIAGVTDPELQALLAEHWEWTMRWSPTWATNLGDHRFDDRLAPRDAAAVERYQSERRDFLARAQRLDAGKLSAQDRETLSLLTGDLAAGVASDVCRMHQWSLSARDNPFEQLSYSLGEGHRVVTPTDGQNLVSRLGQAPRAFDDTIANLRAGLAEGWVASAEVVRRTVEQLDGELAKPVEEWALLGPAKAAHADWPAGEQARFAAQVRRIVTDEIRPAVVRYRDLLRDEVLPKGRAGKAEGLAALPAGAACYQAMILNYLGSPRSAEELHRLGLEQIARSDRELAALGKKLLGARDLAATIERLRSDPKLYFASREQMLTTAESAVARAKAALPRWFGILPKTDCVVREIPAHEAPFTTIAYYREPHYDGTKPGEYFVNTFKPETRPRFDFEALSWHEAIPGHHLQIAISQELGAMPLFRKLMGSTAFVEGWALYTERLADEMGLYSGDLEHLGMWSYDAWRSSRLVVDTGLHAMGWTRAQAEKFMLEHTALTPGNVTNEVDRYIGTPGQALAYKVGQLDILALRALAEKQLGARFDIKAFHDVVLGGGAVTLPVLDERVKAWIAAGGGKVSAPAAR